MPRLAEAIARIDELHREDPETIAVDGVPRPAELVYAERMSAMLQDLLPAASEALCLAARAQHVHRWSLPRARYPMNRAGYHAWRNEQKRRHAAAAVEIMRACDYDDATMARVAALVRKEGLKSDPEAQMLEDVSCLVFLEHYAEAFARKHPESKTVGILAKTWRKMSPEGHAALEQRQVPKPVRELLARALRPDRPDRPEAS